jgi:alcohol dehydrogenase class IV
MALSRFSFPTPIHFGPGARKQAGPSLHSQGFKRPLLVTDKGLAEKAVFAEMRGLLGAAGLEAGVFSGIWGNPLKSQVMAGVAAYRAHQADCIVGFGGGAALDVAKAIALMVHHPGDLFDYEDDLPGARPVDRPVPFWIALPSTSGTGSEVGRSAVISDESSHVKKIIFSPALLAKAVFADPELTLELPAKLTAATGMDALTHVVEAFLAKAYHPLCDGIALEGLHLASQSLGLCVREPKNIEARGSMMMASMMGAIAFQKGLGLVHSCAHALSAHKDLHHGLANGVMIDWALRFNLSAAPERFERLGQAVGLQGQGPEAFLDWLTALKAQIGIPAHLSELGIQAPDVPQLSALAFADSCHQSNPRPVTAADFEAIFFEALG